MVNLKGVVQSQALPWFPSPLPYSLARPIFAVPVAERLSLVHRCFVVRN